jgi:D-alanine-D-alanine ligase
MQKLRVLMLLHDYLVPPERVQGHDTYTVEWRTEYHVLRALTKKLKHEVHVLGVADDLSMIRRAVDEFKPDITFNLLEAFHEIGTFDQNIVSYLELLRVPYTGCNPRGLFLARDKALAKRLLHYHRISVPDFTVMKRRRKVRRPRHLDFPLIVKSLTQDASIGISQASVVTDDTKLVERVQFIHESIGTDAIVEQFIEGREVYCGVLGNERLRVLPVWELTFDNMPERQHKIATERVKWSWKYQNKIGATTGFAADLTTELTRKIQHVSRRVYRVLNMSGYGRIDLRIDDDDRLFVLEANPNPQIAQYEDFALSAAHDGIPYPDLIQRILKLGLSWNPTQRG